MGGDPIPGPLDCLRDMEKDSITAILSSSIRLIKMRPPEGKPETCLECGSDDVERFVWRLIWLGLHHRTVYCEGCGALYTAEYKHPT